MSLVPYIYMQSISKEHPVCSETNTMDSLCGREGRYMKLNEEAIPIKRAVFKAPKTMQPLLDIAIRSIWLLRVVLW